jgi:hypothetical protein
MSWLYRPTAGLVVRGVALRSGAVRAGLWKLLAVVADGDGLGGVVECYHLIVGGMYPPALDPASREVVFVNDEGKSEG